MALHIRGWHPFPLWDSDPSTPDELRPRGKKNPPKGFTGRGGRNATRDEIEAWRDSGRYYNIGCRMPDTVVAIDVDAYHGGSATLEELERKLGKLPKTYVVTARTDGSGHRYYQVPGKRVWRNPGEGIEIIHWGWRYAVFPPSIHPETGTPYKWYGPDGNELVNQLGPKPKDLPLLPPAWVEYLDTKEDPEAAPVRADLTSAETRELLGRWATGDEPCSHVRDALAEAISTTTGGRHDACMRAQLKILRFGEQGHPGARPALDRLRTWFFNTAGAERDVSGEWARGLTQAAQLVAGKPSTSRGCLEVVPEAPDEDDVPWPDEPPGYGRAARRPVDGDGPDVGPAVDEDDGVPITDGVGRDGRERVNVANKERAARWLREELGKGALSGIFYREGQLVYTPRVGEDGYIPRDDPDEDDGPAQVRAVDALDLKTLVEVRYACGVGKDRTVTRTGADGQKVESKVREWEPRMFPRESVTNAHKSALLGECQNIRPLRSVTHTPIVRPDGTILDRPGYDQESRTLYLPDSTLIPPVPDEPTEAEVHKAVDLVTSIVAEFPFVEPYHWANWFGGLFAPLLRAMYPSPYPAFIIDAPAPGSGKSYLAGIYRTVHGGVMRAGFPEDDAEARKSVMGILRDTTAPVVTFDNVRGKLSSAWFEGLLTARTITDRVLGTNEPITVPNDRLWVITANNAEIGGDLARRTLWITIDPRRPRPHERTGFKLDLSTWVPANRGRILHALLTIIRAWVVAGRPAADVGRSDDYSRWTGAVRGLLSWAGFPGGDQFGANDSRHAESAEDLEWLTFLQEAAGYMGMGKMFRAVDLVNRIGTPGIDPSKLPGDLPERWSRIGEGRSKAGFTKSLGLWLKNRSGRYVGDIVVMMKADPKNGNLFWLERYGTQAGNAA